MNRLAQWLRRLANRLSPREAARAGARAGFAAAINTSDQPEVVLSQMQWRKVQKHYRRL